MTTASKLVLLSDYKETPYAVTHVDMVVRLFEGRAEIDTNLSISPRPTCPKDAPLVLDGEEMALQFLAIDGVTLPEHAYALNKGKLTIADVPDRAFKLTTHVVIDPENNTVLEGLYRSNTLWCTQCEAEGFRRITFMYDRPDVLATYRVRLEADKTVAPVLLSNGNPEESGALADGRHFAVWHDPHPKPTYLFALVAGDLDHIEDHFTTMNGKAVTLRIYCETGKGARCTYAMDVLKRSMRWDEQRFGREYDLDVFNIAAVPDFNTGAMENKGLNIFNDKLILADAATATDADFANVERVVSHEYFHNWTGNRITCRDWFQLTLKEGLTVYRDQEFTSDERSRAVKRIDDVKDLWVRQFPEDAGPLSHPPRPDRYEEIDNFYTPTVYEKGAELIRMLETLIGPADFRKGADLYFERHDGEATTVEAWLRCFEDATGRDLTHFKQWYVQAGTPLVRVADEWDETSGTYTLTLTQSTPARVGEEKSPLLIPIRFGLVGQNGADMNVDAIEGAKIEGDVLMLETEQQTVRFSGLGQRPVPSILRGYSAPVKLDLRLTNAQRAFLAKHDQDPVNRWMAIQDIGRKELLAAIAEGEMAGERLGTLMDAIASVLDDPSLDAAYKAFCLDLPSEVELAQALGTNVNPQLVHDIRRRSRAIIGTTLQDKLATVVDSLAQASKDSQAMVDVQQRSLRNRALGLLVATGETAYADLARRLFETAPTLNERLAALGASVAADTQHANDMLDTFETLSKPDPLVWDKWLGLTASRPNDGAVGKVRSIYERSDFPRTNPNRMRALVGSFAMANPSQFTRPDGTGFALITSIIAETDQRNPKLAARLTTAFKSVGMLDAERRAAAESSLVSLKQSGPLSPDLSEILNRIIDAL